MSDTIGPGFSLIKSVLHPTDFSEASLVAFNHALRVAMLAQSKLTLLNVSGDRPSTWDAFPGIRETLERWGTLPKGSPRSAVGEIGIEARKVMASESEPVAAVMRFLNEHPSDLIVLATSHRDGKVRWLGEPVARKTGEITLLIPGDVEGFVSGADGSVNLTKILVPVAETPHPQAAINTAALLVQKLNAPQGAFILMHVGTSNTMPACRYPEIPGWTWDKELRTGEVIGSIVNAAKNHKADLVVMATDGRNGFLDGIRGSDSDSALRHGAAPLLTVPIASRISRYLA